MDMGCGDGFMANKLALSGCFERVMAFDVDWYELELARKSAEKMGLGPDRGFYLFRADVQYLPFQEGSIDFAWWGMGLHMVQDAGVSLAAVHAALRPGGKLLATTIAAGRKIEDLTALAEQAGFAEVRVEQPRPTLLVLRCVK
eukprot:TRINITY_DN33735_c0_g1_i1.p1 TRINITY_DN33735_c0_g1~~TRINITY_DN33735_c0_g1_i1.p1  ORF type:complete len:165 (-),score=42.50 TRINITY_DN33735_c0_g1_i1:35-463(-)